MSKSVLRPEVFSSLCPAQLGFVREFLESGLCIVPLRLDGSKRPLVAWHPFEARFPTEQEVVSWFGRWPRGVAVVCGVISGGLEVLDFDQPEFLHPWLSLLPQELAAKLGVVETPKGFHVYYRCAIISRSKKIAMTEPNRSYEVGFDGSIRVREGRSVRIESRGEGSYVVSTLSAAGVHASGLPYCQVRGPALPCVTRIEPTERRLLWAAARQFDLRGDSRREYLERRIRQLRQEQMPLQHRGEFDGPWSDFDRRAEWRDILTPHGWTSHDDVHWTRPGKSEGVSAKVVPATDGSEVLTVFSSNAGPLSSRDDRKSFGKFSALAELQFGGNRKEAARYVRSLGYGR